jgi:hypothetical protein
MATLFFADYFFANENTKPHSSYTQLNTLGIFRNDGKL